MNTIPTPSRHQRIRLASLGVRGIIVLAALVALLAGCGDDDGAQRLGEGEDAVVLGGDTPDQFPDDIPLPEAAEFVYSDEEYVYHFNVEMTGSQVAEFYKVLPGYAPEGLSGDPVIDDATADMGGTIIWDGGQLVYGAIQPEGTSVLQFTLAP